MSSRFSTVNSRSKVSDQRWASVAASISCALIRTRLPARCTPPSSTVPTPSSAAISRMGLVDPA
jgi:hypothetical protein